MFLRGHVNELAGDLGEDMLKLVRRLHPQNGEQTGWIYRSG
jgi:hypothetical protein